MFCPQGPLRNTCGHFWLMMWEQKTKAVIMLNRVIEKGSVSKNDIILIWSDMCHLSTVQNTHMESKAEIPKRRQCKPSHTQTPSVIVTHSLSKFVASWLEGKKNMQAVEFLQILYLRIFGPNLSLYLCRGSPWTFRQSWVENIIHSDCLSKVISIFWSVSDEPHIEGFHAKYCEYVLNRCS